MDPTRHATTGHDGRDRDGARLRGRVHRRAVRAGHGGRRAPRPWPRPGTPASATSTPRPGTAGACPSCGPGPALRDHPRGEFACRPRSVAGSSRPRARASTARRGWVARPNEVVFDYTYDGIMRSVEQSRLRLGITRFDVAVHPRPRSACTSTRRRSTPISATLAGVRLASARGAPLERADRGHRGGDQRARPDPALPGHRGHRRVPHRDAVHPARPGGAGRGVPGVRGTRRRFRHRGAVPVRDPGQGARCPGPSTTTPTPRRRSMEQVAPDRRGLRRAMASRWRPPRSSSRWVTRRSPR